MALRTELSNALPNHNLLHAVRILQQHGHILECGSRHILSDVVRADGQLPVPSVDEHRELDHAWTSDVEERIHRCANRAPRVEHIIHKYNSLARDVQRHLRRVHDGLIGELVEIVAVKCDVEHTARQVMLLNACNLCSNPRGNRHAARTNTDEDKVLRPLVLLDDLMCNPHQCTPNPVLVHKNGLFPKLRHAVISLSSAAQCVQNLLHVCGDRCREGHRRPCARMRQAERQRVQRLPRNGKGILLRCILRISDERMPDARQVDADLMRAPRLKTTGNIGIVAEPFQYLKMCGRGLAVLPHNRHFLAIGRMASDIARDDACARDNVAVYNRTVFTPRLLVPNLTREEVMRHIVFRRDHDPRGVLIETVHNPRAQRPIDPREIPAVPEECVDQRPRRDARRRVNHHAAHLIDDDIYIESSVLTIIVSI